VKAVAAAWNAVGVYNKDENPTGIVDGRSKMDDGMINVPLLNCKITFC
jgi:hypothetical protein